MGKYLPRFLEDIESQSLFPNFEVVIDHNDPEDWEIELVNKYINKYPKGVIKHIITRPVDPIGTSMNTCIKNSKGAYLAIWNIDDLRTPDSLEIMKDALDESDKIDFAYGNYKVVRSFGATEGEWIDEAGNEEWLKIGMILGPFFMFKKSILKKSKEFDEQLVQGADYDLALRLAFNGKGVHCPEHLGYYLNEGLGQSTKADSKQPLERTVIEMRYGIRILEESYIPLAESLYDVKHLHIRNEKIPALDLQRP